MERTTKQFWKALDWFISLLIWMTFVTIATPILGFWAAIVYKMFKVGYYVIVR